jgi:hypothetical protein
MTKSANIDYVGTYFEIPELTKIHARPTFENLKIIKNELKTNGSSVTTDLGGGINGHVGLVTTLAEYALISAIPYVRPVHPGALVLPTGVGTTTLHREIARDDHNEAVRVFREVVDIEKALIKQLVQAVPEVYMKPFRNQYSNSVNVSLSSILTSLFNTYRKVQDDTLQEATDKLRARIYDISQPLVVMFNDIQELNELSIAADNEYTERQLVNIGIQLIKNTNDFERGLESWIIRPAVEKTWINFKAHFELAHTNLVQLRGPLMKNSAFTNTANAITASVIESVREELNDDRSRVFQRLDETESSILNALTVTPRTANTSVVTDDESTTSTMTERVNATVSDSIQLEILKLLKDIQRNINGNQVQATTNGLQQGTKGKGKKKRKRLDTSKYCWSCGAWNHLSVDCRFKKDGHKDNATFANKMNGSTYYCQPVTTS